MKDNTGVYFILSLMCIIIGFHYWMHSYFGGRGAAGTLLALGFLILFIQVIRGLRYLNNYDPDAEEKKSENKEEDQK